MLYNYFACCRCCCWSSYFFLFPIKTYIKVHKISKYICLNQVVDTDIYFFMLVSLDECKYHNFIAVHAVAYINTYKQIMEINCLIYSIIDTSSINIALFPYLFSSHSLHVFYINDISFHFPSPRSA